MGEFCDGHFVFWRKTFELNRAFFVDKRKDFAYYYRLNNFLKDIFSEGLALTLNLLFKIIHLRLPLDLSFSQFSVLRHRNSLLVLLTPNLELVKQFATLRKLYLTDQVDNSDSKYLAKDCLEQLLS